MKYLKTFESTEEPQIGDYIIVKPKMWANIIFRIEKKEKFFWNFNEERDVYCAVGVTDKWDELKFTRNEIKYWSKTQDELETILTASKYNL